VALQTAFDDAWGTRLAPYGLAGSANNRAVYLPPGDYRISQSLYITGVVGSRLFGDSGGNTSITIFNPMAGNLWRPNPPGGDASEMSPAICMNGCSHFTWDGVSIKQAYPIGTPADFGSCAVWFINIYHTGGSIATAPVFRNMSIENFQHGIMVGYEGPDGGGNSENGTLYNVYFKNCTSSCLMTFHANVLNWAVVGGGAENCSTDGGVNSAVYSGVTGAISTVSGVDLRNNGLDFKGGWAGISVMGGRSTSIRCCETGTQAFFSGFTYAPENSLNCLFQSQASSCTQISGCVFAPENNNGAGVIGNCNAAGRMVVDGLVIGPGGAACSFAGTGGTDPGALYLRGIKPVGAQNIFSGFLGIVADYTPIGGTYYAAMPAHDKFRGLKRIIRDSPATSGLITGGGGSNWVYTYCAGASGWQIIGPVDADA
jgi:hypothetical protein